MVDTDVVSYFFKGDTRAVAYEPLLAGRLRVVSFMSQAELYQWAETARWGNLRRFQLDTFLQRFIVVPQDTDLCRAWATVRDSARRAGRPIEVADAWIAATALFHGLPLVTNNPADYAGVGGLRLLTASKA